MTLKPHCPSDCYQGSTEFYDSPDTDEFTPSYATALPLVDNVGTRKDGTIPPWMADTDDSSVAEHSQQLTPSERYVEWFNGIWHTGDPDTWNATVFTNDAVDQNDKPLLKGFTTVTFAEHEGDKTKLTLQTRAEGLVDFAPQMLKGMDQGWSQSFDKLATHVSAVH